MDAVYDHLLRILGAAILCGAANAFMSKKSTISAVVKLISGLFLAVTVIQPFVNLRLNNLPFLTADLRANAISAAQNGESMACLAYEQVIISETQAYILDKAAAMEVDLDVEVILHDQVPGEVILKGAVSPYAKQAISAWLEETLGIPKEAQQWTG